MVKVSYPELAYKAVYVHKNGTRSSAFLGYYYDPDNYRFLTIRYNVSSVILFYPPGERVAMKPNSYGIFCFRTYQDAQHFVSKMGEKGDRVEIIKVLGFDRRKLPVQFSALIRRVVRRYWEDPIPIDVGPARVPMGTICYREIKCLE